MTSERRKRNRANAAKSTGPKTPEGKRKASENAVVRHGLRAAKLTIPGLEDEREWMGFRTKMLSALKPKGFLETAICERIAAQAWRLRRGLRFEVLGAERRQEAAADTAVIFGKTGPSPAEQKACVLPDERGLNLISRYETSIERSFLRLVHELERLQAARQGKQSPITIGKTGEPEE